MKILGIDVGINGAACLIEGRAVLDAIDLPTIGEGSKREINVRAFGRWLEAASPDHAFIENVAAMPSIPGPDGVRRGMGAASAFRFGLAVGQIRATVACYEIPMTLVVPQSWKRHHGLKGSDKEQSRQLCLRLMPAAGHFLQRKLDHQRAESILLAMYGRNKIGLLAAA